MSSFKLDSSGKGDIPLADKKLSIFDWSADLRKSIETAYETKIRNMKLLYGGINGEHFKELPILAVKNLRNQRFVLKNLSVPVGYTFNLVAVQQYPSQQNEDTPLFELEEFSNHYLAMDFDMNSFYAEAYSGPHLDLKKAPIGTCAVVRKWSIDLDNSEKQVHSNNVKPVVKRIRILGVADSEGQAYSVEYVDFDTKSILDSTSEVYPMDKFFATLPPKICEIELEGLAYYKGVEAVRRLLRYNSDEYIFDDTPVTAQVQKSGQVLIWNARFPKEKFPYGINGFLLKGIWEVMSYGAQLPPAGCERKEGYIVHADSDANIWLQFNSPFAIHFYDLLSEITDEKIKLLKGTVKRPKRGVIYMAPHHRSDGSYYRAEVISSEHKLKMIESPEDEVKVYFIDYGDTAVVQVKSLVKAEDAHVILPHFPRLCVKAHLENIWAFEPDNFMNSFQCSEESTYAVYVMKEESVDAPAEVILKKYLDEDEETYWVLNVEVVQREVADHADPFYDYEAAMEQVKKDWVPNHLKGAMPPYLGLGKATTGRLQIGSEINVSIMWDRKMPRGWFFIRAIHRQNIFKQMEVELTGLKGKLLNKNQKTTKKYRWTEREQGMAVLVTSKRVLHVLARGILICKVKERNENEEKSEGRSGRNEADSKLKNVKVFWKVCLFDYGLVERVDSLNIFDCPLKFLQIPAFGILAKHKSFVEESHAQEWWYSMSWNREDISEGEIEEYDESRCERKKISIFKLSNGPYGEMAVVDWVVTQTNMEENVDNFESKGEEQIVEESQENLVDQNKLGDADLCEFVDSSEISVNVATSPIESGMLRSDHSENDIIDTTKSSIPGSSSYDLTSIHFEEICESVGENDEIFWAPRQELGVEYCASDSSEDSIF